MKDEYKDIAHYLQYALTDENSKDISDYIEEDLTREEQLLIDHYIDKKCTAKELAVFKHRLKTDSAFVKKAKGYLMIRDFVIKTNELELTDYLETQALALKPADDGRNRGNARTIFFNKKYLGIAATLLLLAVSTFIYTWFISKKTGKELFETYYAMPVDVVRSSVDSIPIIQAVDLYKSGQYDKAIAFFSKEIQERPENLKAHFYLAHCYLAIDSLQQAITSFQQITDNTNNLYFYDAQWYLALAYFKDEAPEKAKKELQIIANGHNEKYREQAIRILRELE